MKPLKDTPGMEAAGSLVPELEGAGRSASHGTRLAPAPAAAQTGPAPQQSRGEGH